MACVYKAIDAVEPGDFRVAQQFARLDDTRVFWGIARALSCDYKAAAIKHLIQLRTTQYDAYEQAKTNATINDVGSQERVI